MSNYDYPIERYARPVGFAYLTIIVLGIIGQVLIRGALVVPGDAPQTVQNIMANTELWRLGIGADVLMHICDIPVIVFLFLLLRRVNYPMALIALVSNIVQTAVALANKLNLIIPLVLLEPGLPGPVKSSLVALFVNAHDYGFGLALIFFGIACILYSRLLIQARVVPKLLGFGMGAAGVCYLLNSWVLLLAPQFSGQVMVVLVVCLMFEFSFACWLIFRGVATDRLAPTAYR